MLESAQPVVEDVDDPDEVSQCVSIDIPVEGSPDAASAAVHPEALVDLEGKMAALLAAHASETRKLEGQCGQRQRRPEVARVSEAGTRPHHDFLEVCENMARADRSCWLLHGFQTLRR